MTIEVLVIEPDGRQHFEVQELPDNWYEQPGEANSEEG